MDEKFFGELSDNKFIDEDNYEYSLKEMLRQCFATCKKYTNVDEDNNDCEGFSIGRNEKCSSIIKIEEGDKDKARDIVESHKLIKKLSEQ